MATRTKARRKKLPGEFVLVLMGSKPPAFLADTRKMKLPPVTRDVTQAVKYKRRGSILRLRQRDPRLRQHFTSTRAR